MDAMTLLTTRRSAPLKMMTGPGPDRSAVEAMLAVAARVPDHGKLTPWRFLILEEPGRTRLGAALADFWREDHPDADEERLAMERARPDRGPMLVVAIATLNPQHPKIPEWEQILSGGAACMNLCHAATAMGWRASWVTEWPAYDARVHKLFELGENDRILGFIYLGSAGDVPDRPRPAPDDIATVWA